MGSTQTLRQSKASGTKNYSNFRAHRLNSRTPKEKSFKILYFHNISQQKSILSYRFNTVTWAFHFNIAIVLEK